MRHELVRGTKAQKENRIIKKPLKYKNGHWENIHNHRILFNNILAPKLCVHTLDGWYNVTAVDASGVDGATLLRKKYKGSIITALTKAYPHYKWLPWKFTMSPMRFWEKRENIRDIVNVLADTFGVKELDEWYGIYHRDIIDLGAYQVLHQHSGSLHVLLRDLYPKHKWKWELFVKPTSPLKQKIKREPTRYKHPTGFWRTRRNQFDFLKRVERSLGISGHSGWYRVSQTQLSRLGGGGIIPLFPRVLRVIDDTHPWDWNAFKLASKKSSQRHLRHLITDIFPDAEILEEHSIDIRQVTGSPLTVDLFLPEYNLALEYQGELHYGQDMPHVRPSVIIQHLDAEKSEHCLFHGVSLVPIPYWYTDANSVAATIHYYAPRIKLNSRYDLSKPLIGSVPQQGTKTINLMGVQNERVMYH